MTLADLVLGLLVVWSLTLLVTRDQITAGPRRALHKWLRIRAHHALAADDCSCGWTADHEDDCSATLYEHISLARHASLGWWFTMLTCPWCVSFWLAIPIAAAAWALDAATWWQAIAFPFAARTIAGAATARLYPDDDG